MADQIAIERVTSKNAPPEKNSMKLEPSVAARLALEQPPSARSTTEALPVSANTDESNIKELTVPAIETTGTRSIQSSAERLSADSHANGSLSEQQKSELDVSINKFISLAKEKHLSNDEITRTLDATSALLEGKSDGGGKALSPQNRAWLAESVMHNVSNPDRVDQGFHNTCNVTAISKRLMDQDPAKMAEMVSFVGLNGFYRSTDGAVIKLDSKSLSPDAEAAGGETIDNKRNYASQVFDVTAINNYWQRQFPPHEYIQTTPTGQGDTGERLLNFAGKQEVGSDGKPLDQPVLDCRAMIAIGRQLGMKDNFLIANSHADSAAGALVDSEQSLGKTLSDMQSGGRLPAVIFVRSDNKLFTGAYNSGDTGGWHVITVDNYDEKTGSVHIANQWGAANDRTVSLSLLYDATLPPKLWASCPGYMDRDQFERFHQYMAGGGAGLDKSGVLTASEMQRFLEESRKKLQQELPPEVQNELYVLHTRLEKAESEQDSSTISQIMGEINSLQRRFSP